MSMTPQQPDTSLTVRPWAEGDDLKLLEVFGDPATPVQHGDRAMLGPATTEPFGAGLVAEIDGIPVAAGSLRTQRVHPQRFWVYVETAPAERGRGVATHLLNELRDAAGSTPLKTRSAAADEDTTAFLRGHGFVPINTSRRVRLDAGSLPPLGDNPGGAVLEQLATGSVELSQVVSDYYQAIHQDWDPAEISLTRAQQLLLAPETGAAPEAIVLRDKPKADGGAIQAFAIRYEAPLSEIAEGTPPPVEVLFGADPTLSAEDAQHVVSVLVAKIVAETELPAIVVDLDEYQPALAPIVNTLLDAGHATIDTESIIWATDVTPVSES